MFSYLKILVNLRRSLQETLRKIHFTHFLNETSNYSNPYIEYNKTHITFAPYPFQHNRRPTRQENKNICFFIGLLVFLYFFCFTGEWTLPDWTGFPTNESLEKLYIKLGRVRRCSAVLGYLPLRGSYAIQYSDYAKIIIIILFHREIIDTPLH